jgi:predicted flap endonuclease-1-like 5' DNA nuclease
MSSEDRIENNRLTKNIKIMGYKIIDVEGIGDAYAKKLKDAGIDTVDELLEKCAKPAGRKALEEQTGISGKLILTWTNHADLMRINGVGPQFSELLEAAGVDTVKELKHRVAANLHAKLVETNEEKNLVNRVPAEVEVQKMIDQAKELPALMEY